MQSNNRHYRRGQGAAARLPRRLGRDDPAGAACDAHGDAEGAGPRRPQDVEVLRQHHRPARRSGRGREEDAHDADGPRPRPPHRSRYAGKMPGVGPAQALPARETTRAGAYEGCKTAGIGCLDCKKPVIEKVDRRDHHDAQTCAGIRRESGTARGTSLPKVQRKRAKPRATRSTKCAGPCIFVRIDLMGKKSPAALFRTSASLPASKSVVSCLPAASRLRPSGRSLRSE